MPCSLWRCSATSDAVPEQRLIRRPRSALIRRKNQLVGHRRRNTICLVLDTIGALTRRCLSTIAHVDPAVAMLPIRNRAREGTAHGSRFCCRNPRSEGRWRTQFQSLWTNVFKHLAAAKNNVDLSILFSSRPEDVTNSTFPSLARNAFVAAKWMPAKSVAHRDNCLSPVLSLIA
jgi:hypothetical protein